MTITIQNSPLNFVNELKEWLKSKGQTAEILVQNSALSELDEAIAEIQNGGGKKFDSFVEYQKEVRE